MKIKVAKLLEKRMNEKLEKKAMNVGRLLAGAKRVLRAPDIRSAIGVGAGVGATAGGLYGGLEDIEPGQSRLGNILRGAGGGALIGGATAGGLAGYGRYADRAYRAKNIPGIRVDRMNRRLDKQMMREQLAADEAFRARMDELYPG